MQNKIPLVRVTIDGVTVQGVITAHVQAVGRYGADRFMIEAPLGTTQFSDSGYYGSLAIADIVIEISQSSSGYFVLFTGQLDNIKIDYSERIVQLCGRDLSAKLIDTEISETFANKTSSQIAESIAAKHGLIPNITPTLKSVGQYYELDHARSILGINSRSGSEWDLLSWLAQLENFDVTVDGTTLNFAQSPSNLPIILNIQDCIEISIDTAKTIPQTATVKSWNTRQKKAYTINSGTTGGSGTTLIRPNLTTEQALVLANYHRECLMQHMSILTVKMPGDLTMMPGFAVLLTGTASILDQVYVIDSVVREISVQGGFVQTLRAHAQMS